MVFISQREHRIERVQTDEWIRGEIVGEKVFNDQEQKYTDDDGNPAIRMVDKISFHFKLEGYNSVHYSPKMTISMSEKSNLYKFLAQLYGDRILPDVAVDTSLLKGIKVKTMWADSKYKNKQGEPYQNLTLIRAINPDNLPAIWDVMPPKEDELFIDEQEPSEETPY